MPTPKKIYFSNFTALNSKKEVPHLIKRSGLHIVFPFYHVVSDAQLPHIRHLYNYKNTAQFEADLDFLLQYYEPLSADQLVKKEYSDNKNYFVLTFDDGLREMFDVVAPILNRKGIPATFFINPDFIDNRDVFYRYTVSLITDHLTPPITETVTKFIHAERHKHVADLPAYLLSLHYEDKDFIKKIAAAAGVDINAFLLKQSPYLTTDQLKQLQQSGFTIGAHSMDHPLYELIPLQEQIDQTVKSIEYVMDRFHQPFNYFAFPFTDHGVKEPFFTRIYTGPEHPVHFSFGCAGMAPIRGRHIQRMPMELEDYSGEEIIKNEYGYYLLKRTLGIK